MTPANRMDDDRHRRPSLRLVAGEDTRAPRDEETLVAAFLVGDDDAFGELVRRHEPMVLGIVRRYATTPDDARDLAQRTFLRAFEAARRSLRRGPRAAVPFRRWLVRVAVNLGKNHLRDALRVLRAPVEAVDERAGGAEGEEHLEVLAGGVHDRSSCASASRSARVA